jgi:hypothetical protein
MLRLPVCALGLLMPLAGAQAQRPQFSLGAGAGIPLGAYDDVVKLGWQATGAVSFAPRSLPVGIQIDASYAQFSDETPFDIKNQLVYGTANARYQFESGENTRWRPYLIGGLGIYNSRDTGSDALEGSATKLGVNAGAGFDFKAGSAALFLEGRFHNVFSDGPNVKFFPVTLGIRLGGG